eukprot:jgi/Ulvmu1/9783/UM056_0023.1
MMDCTAQQASSPIIVPSQCTCGMYVALKWMWPVIRRQRTHLRAFNCYCWDQHCQVACISITLHTVLNEEQSMHMSPFPHLIVHSSLIQSPCLSRGKQPYCCRHGIGDLL